MAAQRVDLKGSRRIDQGQTWRLQLNLKDPAQLVTVGGSPAGGNFRLAWRGFWTKVLAHNATAAAIQRELELLPGVGTGNVTVTGAAGGPWTVTFADLLRARVRNPLLDVDYTNLVAYGGSVSVVKKAVDLTGYTARMQVRASVTDPQKLVELTTANSRIALGGTAGTVTLTLTDAVTAAFLWTRGMYDLELVSGASEVVPLLHGDVEVRQEVTR